MYVTIPLNTVLAHICHAKGHETAEGDEAAGERIADAPGHMQAVAATKWSVYPETARGIMYVVVLGVKGLACDCPQDKFGKGLCKHVAAVDSWLARRWAALHKGGSRAFSGRRGARTASRAKSCGTATAPPNEGGLSKSTCAAAAAPAFTGFRD